MARPRGRPSNRQRWDEQSAQILRLRQLLSRRHHSEETWLLIDQLLSLIGELEDLSTPLRAVTYDGTGHAAENPLLPGVTLTDVAGDRTLHHAGTEAVRLHGWVLQTVKWTIDRAKTGLTRAREPAPRPALPRVARNARNSKTIETLEKANVNAEKP